MLKSILKKDTDNNSPSTKKVVFSKKINYKTIPNRHDINDVPVSETFKDNDIKTIDKPKRVPKVIKSCETNTFVWPNCIFIIMFIIIMLILLTCNKTGNNIRLDIE